MWPIIAAVVIIVVAIVGVFSYIYFTRNTTSFICNRAVEGSCTITIQGAGASFPAPLIQNWTLTYHVLYPNVTVNYSSVGSTAGRQLITNKTVDFGASDAPLTDAQIVAAPGLILFPETLGGVAITYNLPAPFPQNVNVNFTGQVLSMIYNGTITNWNDARLQSLNTATLPNLAISAVRRADGSGTTYAFKDYLAHVDTWWSAHVAVDTSATWPSSGPSGQGNAGVAGQVATIPGAIGYVDVIYAFKISLPQGAVQNRNGFFVTPTLQSIVYAAANETVITSPTDLRQHIVNAHGDQSYPIATYTYIMVYKEMSTNSRTTQTAAYALAKFLWWIIGPSGQAKAPLLIYAPLPSNIVAADQNLLKSLTWAGQQIITS